MEGLTGADIESLCKKAALLAIAEFQEGARAAPFVVLRSDFLMVLESDRGSPKQLKRANALSNSAGELCPDASR
jgi:SpoVK/Ycf46/Vps4 family AAA+-type ATPase